LFDFGSPSLYLSFIAYLLSHLIISQRDPPSARHSAGRLTPTPRGTSELRHPRPLKLIVVPKSLRTYDPPKGEGRALSGEGLESNRRLVWRIKPRRDRWGGICRNPATRRCERRAGNARPLAPREIAEIQWVDRLTCWRGGGDPDHGGPRASIRAPTRVNHGAHRVKRARHCAPFASRTTEMIVFRVIKGVGHLRRWP